jgi:hypothetical protein
MGNVIVAYCVTLAAGLRVSSNLFQFQIKIYFAGLSLPHHIQLLQQIKAHHPTAASIYIICDNARYY